MSEVVVRLEPRLVFSSQAADALQSRPARERAEIVRAIETKSRRLLRLYQRGRRTLPRTSEPGLKRWVLVKLQDCVAVVNQFGTQVRVHLVLHKDERERWDYADCLFRVLKNSSSRAIRIVEITLRNAEQLVSVNVFLFHGSLIRHREWILPEKKSWPERVTR